MSPEFQKSLDAFMKFGRDFRAAEKLLARRLAVGPEERPTPLYDMKNSIKNILQGAGSILDIMPSREPVDYSKFVPHGTPEERMRETWDRVGYSLKIAMDLYADEQKIKKTSSATT